MSKPASTLEIALAHYLKTGEKNEHLCTVEEENDYGEFHTMVEIAIVPDHAHSSLDSLWIDYERNKRLGACLKPGDNLKRFFQFLNVHPRDVLRQDHLSIQPAADESYYNSTFRDFLNKSNAEVVKQYLDLLTDFEESKDRPALCSPKIAAIIMDNASYGGYPLIAGWARVSEIMELDFSKPMHIAGKYQVGIMDNVNGSGHMEGADARPFEMEINRGDLIVCSTKGYTPDHIFGFVGSFYRLELSTAKEAIPA